MITAIGGGGTNAIAFDFFGGTIVEKHHASFTTEQELYLNNTVNLCSNGLQIRVQPEKSQGGHQWSDMSRPNPSL